MPKQGKNLTDLRASNQGALLRFILANRTATQQQLAAALQLTPMSISYITTELLEKGYLRETPTEGSSARGRRAKALSLVTEELLAVSVSVSRRAVRISTVDVGGAVLSTTRVPLAADTTADRLTAVIERGIAAQLAAVDGRHVLGIGVSCVGLVNMHDGIVVSATDFYGIPDWPIGEHLEKRFGLPVFVAEDMKAAALAECYYGVGGTQFVYVGITHGIGAAVIADGKLLAGEHGYAGELGHTTLYPDGPSCPCGNHGCAELYLSVPVVLKNAGCTAWEDFTADADSPAMQRFLSDLATVLTGVVNLFDPEAVILGHEGALLPAVCYKRLQQALARRTMTRHLKTVCVLPSALARHVTAQSGAAIVFDRLFAGEFKL